LNSIKVTILNHYYCFSAEINVRENRRDNAEYEIQRDMQYWAHEDKPKAQKTTKGRLKLEEQTIQCPQEKYNDLQNTMQSSNTNTNLTINQGSVHDASLE
jgi:hypothetical protein